MKPLLHGIMILTGIVSVLLTGCYQGESISGDLQSVASEDSVIYAINGKNDPWNFTGTLIKPFDSGDWKLSGTFEFPSTGYKVETVIQTQESYPEKVNITFFIQEPSNSLAQIPVVVIEPVEATISASDKASFKVVFREGDNPAPRCGYIIII